MQWRQKKLAKVSFDVDFFKIPQWMFLIFSYLEPEIYVFSSLANQEINEAISFTEPNLPMGIVFRISSMPVLPSILCVRSVSIKPGH